MGIVSFTEKGVDMAQCSIGQIIKFREEMSRLKISQEELAARLGVSKAFVAHRLGGFQSFSKETLAEWRTALVAKKEA
jgi:transcriptional regulator with XRE-family HTH domain